MELEYVVMVILTVFVIILGTGILLSTVTGVSITDAIQGTINKMIGYIFSGTAYNICEDFNNKKLSVEEFRSLLQSIDKGKCGYAQSYIRFSLTEADIKKMTDVIGIERTVIISEGKPKALGVGSLQVYGSPGPSPLKLDDLVEIKKAGTPTPDILITVIQQGCDPYDEDCDPSCSFKSDLFESGICDPYCYQHEKSEGALCDIDCVDVNKNGTIDKGDFDDICDLDCYDNLPSPNNAYDPDCIKLHNEKDDICDPDSNGVVDGICDPDCADPSPDRHGYHICDFDCDGDVAEGNPSALLDEDCYVCDGECNNFCSPACLKGEDPDCIDGYGSKSECCGNNICALGESCENCEKDCPPGTSCKGLYPGSITICCPEREGDAYGCAAVEKVNLTEGEECVCDVECNNTLRCNKNRCCPPGKQWNGTECVYSGDVLIVAIKSNMQGVYSDNEISKLEEKIGDFIVALGDDDLGGMFLYLDGDMTSNIIGNKVTAPNSWSNVDGILDQLIRKLNTKYVLIIGGMNRFPLAKVGSNTGSDDPYGDYNLDGGYLPDIPVGRIPDPLNGDIDVIMNALDTATALHKSGGLVLTDHIAPIMGCGGYDNRPWNPGKCFCQAIWGTSFCAADCGCIEHTRMSGKDYAVILAHGPGPEPNVDYYQGGCVSMSPSDVSGLDVSGAVWMPMSCGGGHLQKSKTSQSILMTFLKEGGAVYMGSTDLNYGNTGACSVPGGDCCIGSLYTEIAKSFSVGKRIGDAYQQGKINYVNYPSTNGCGCEAGHAYQYHINIFYGDPTLKIKEMW